MEPMNLDQNTDINPDNPSVVYGHKQCLTQDVKWLCLDNIYSKFHRPNFYDIGGTYIVNKPDCWFTFKTENIAEVFLLHLFITKKSEESYTITLSSSNEITYDKKNSKAAFLKNCIQEYVTDRKKSQDEISSFEYITTYNFNEMDIDFLKERKLYISIDFSTHNDLSLNVVNDIKSKHDCQALLEDPFGYDFCIESSDKTVFKVHKLILSAHSEVFKAMFNDHMAESQNNYVKLIDVTSDDLRYMLEFIYTGTLKDFERADFVTLLMLSDRYNLAGLRELANHALTKQLTEESALDILVIADMYGANSLKYEALKFIKKNKKSLQSGTFKEINNANIVKELCIYLAS